MTRKEFECMKEAYEKLGLKPISKDEAAKFIAAASIVDYKPKDGFYNEVYAMASSYKDIEHIVYFHLNEFNAFPERADEFLRGLLT